MTKLSKNPTTHKKPLTQKNPKYKGYSVKPKVYKFKNITHQGRQFELYKILKAEYYPRIPDLEYIIESFGLNIKWCLHSIRIHNDRMTLYSYQSMSMNPTAGPLITKHKISFQVPGNTEYKFNLSLTI